MKLIFAILSLIGTVVISILAFILPSNPYEIIPAISIMGFDKPLWFAIIMVCSFFYLVALYSLYNYLEQRKIA